LKYKNAISFRQALEERLAKKSKQEGIDLAWLRKQVAFDRFLARIFFETQKPRWLLKGGYAMELRYAQIARTTKDVDLSLPFAAFDAAKEKQLLEPIREELQQLAGRDLGEWFIYLIEAPIMDIEAAPYGGARFPVRVTLAGRHFTNFNLDVGIGDAVILEPEWLEDHHLLEFAEIASSRIPLLPKEHQFAEKIHTYTLPREGNPNSRTRDLLDMVLLIEQGALDHDKLKKSLEATFKRRNTHSIPARLSEPPESWATAYAKLAQDCGVAKKNVNEAFKLLEEFWNKLYKG